jgi:hypothetical protein
MKRRGLLTLSLLLACGCGSGRVERKIVERALEACKSAEACTINVNDLTDFQWDKMYVFKYNATPEQIRRALGFELPGHTEFTRKVVFVKGGRVVHREEYPVDVEGALDGEAIFDLPDTEVYKAYTADRASFRVERKRFEGKAYYALTQIN